MHSGKTVAGCIPNFSVNQQQAVNDYRAALAFFDPNTLPVECLKAGRSLGNLGFELGNWEIAVEGYSKAIAAVEQTRAWSTEESRREEIQAQSIEVYTNIVQALIQLQRYPAAMQYAERSRSKRLSDLMRTNDFYPKGEIPAEIQANLAEYDRLQRQIDEIYHRLEGHPQQLTLDTLRRSISPSDQELVDRLQAQQTVVWRALRRLDPIAATGKKVTALEIAEIGQLLGDSTSTALLSCFSTDQDTYIFVARRDAQQQLQIQIHHCSGQGTSTLQNWIFEKWIKPYKNQPRQWEQEMSGFLQECSQRLAIDTLIETFLQDGIQELIIIPHLYLHQIPFAALPLAAGDLLGNSPMATLGERFTIRYAPSCEILKICADRDPVAGPLNYGIIEGASLDVPYAPLQGEAIAATCNIAAQNRLRGQAAASVDDFRLLLQVINALHSYHHASSNPNEPLKSSLALGDGEITLAQLLVLQLQGLQEVFLSCCETSFGIAQSITDEVFTLASGFLCAGARTVIATHWSVDQLSAALLSIFYYEHRQKSDRPRALQAAQQQLRELSGQTLEDLYGDRLESCWHQHIQELRTIHQATTGSEKDAAADRVLKAEIMREHLSVLYGEEYPFSHPIYWAAFTCQGLA